MTTARGGWWALLLVGLAAAFGGCGEALVDLMGGEGAPAEARDLSVKPGDFAEPRATLDLMPRGD